jgi:hypothetical protein
MCSMACSSLDRHLHTIAYESLEKLLNARDKKNCAKEKNWDRDTQSDLVRLNRTLSGQTRLCPGGGLG